MYTSIIRNIKNLSNHLKNQDVCKNASLIFPMSILDSPKPLTNCCYTRKFCYENVSEIEKNPLIRKQKIDDRAALEIEVLKAKDPDMEKKIKVLELEIEVLRQEGLRVPTEIRPRDMVELLEVSSRQKRIKLLNYLFINEVRRNRTKRTTEENDLIKEKIRSERSDMTQNGNLVYEIGYNFMLRRIGERAMNELWNWNCLKAIMFGNKLVFDFSYEKHMNGQEIKSCAKQITESYSENRHHNYPFEIFLCNVNFSGPLIEKVSRYLPTIFDKDFPMTVTSKSYLDLFEKPKLVYLSADAPVVLEKYDSESVYIIGAYVDKGKKVPLSMAKAKEQKIRMARLPLDQYLQFGDGSNKNLTLDQVSSIMLDSQVHNWEKALLHVPRRKLQESRLHALERRLEKEKLMLKPQQITEMESFSVTDFSNNARLKLREQWHK